MSGVVVSCGAGSRTMKESVIRLMTRLAMKHEAVNLSQGFTDEAPLFELAWGGMSAVLGGEQSAIDRLDGLTLAQAGEDLGVSTEQLLGMPLKQLLARLQNPRDQYTPWLQKCH